MTSPPTPQDTKTADMSDRELVETVYGLPDGTLNGNTASSNNRTKPRGAGNIASTVALIGETADMRGIYRKRNVRLWRYVSRKRPLLEWQLNLQFEPRDLWVGAFSRVRDVERLRFLHIYVCLLPMIPLHLTVMWLRQSNTAHEKG